MKEQGSLRVSKFLWNTTNRPLQDTAYLHFITPPCCWLLSYDSTLPSALFLLNHGDFSKITLSAIIYFTCLFVEKYMIYHWTYTFTVQRFLGRLPFVVVLLCVMCCVLCVYWWRVPWLARVKVNTVIGFLPNRMKQVSGERPPVTVWFIAYV